MFADDDRVRFFASKSSKNLRTFAIKSVAKLHVRRNRLRPPVVFDVSIFFNVAHGILNSVILSEAKPQRSGRSPRGQACSLSSWEVSRCIKSGVNAAAG